MLSRIKDANDPATVPWQMNTLDATGRVLDETLGAGVRVVTGFDSYGGRLSSRQAGVGGGNALQNLYYEWDANDNLTARRDYQQSPPVHETFTYDTLDRLDTSMRNGTTNLDVNYDASGNVTSKSDVGSYTYDATKIHAVKTAGSNSYSYDANGNVITRNGSTLGWTSYDRPSRIDNGTGTVSYLWYGPDRRLWRQEAYSAGANETTVYVGELLEKVTKDGVTSWKHYVEAPTGTAAVYLRRSDGTASTYYLTHDHLGSTDKVLDASGGIVTVAESFTALGARRGANWQGTPTPAELAAIASTTRDGFTGHVMLDNVGLVHMQGRVYDPAIGRFLSVDPVVRDVAAPQSWNGYGYVEGRVLSATDPTGYEACIPNQAADEDPIVSFAKTTSWFGGNQIGGNAPGFVQLWQRDLPDIGGSRSSGLFGNWNGCIPLDVFRAYVAELFGLVGASWDEWPGNGWDDSLAGLPFLPFVGIADDVARTATVFHKHHTIPREILKHYLPADVAKAVRGKAGAPNRWSVPVDLHKAIHKGSGGGAYNEAFKQRLGELGRRPTADDVFRIRDELVEQFGLGAYRP